MSHNSITHSTAHSGEEQPQRERTVEYMTPEQRTRVLARLEQLVDQETISPQEAVESVDILMTLEGWTQQVRKHGVVERNLTLEGKSESGLNFTDRPLNEAEYFPDDGGLVTRVTYLEHRSGDTIMQQRIALYGDQVRNTRYLKQSGPIGLLSGDGGPYNEAVTHDILRTAYTYVQPEGSTGAGIPYQLPQVIDSTAMVVRG
jgi:hypothetical protein